jgi:DNA polymerase-1
MVLSDYELENWRKAVYPDYKSNRTEKRRPILWSPLRDYIQDVALDVGDMWTCEAWPGLEGDDVLGILMTQPFTMWEDGEERVCVSIDKDLLTIPGLHANYLQAFNANEHLSEWLHEQTEEEADRFHLLQSVAGDMVDGYSGCPGIGMVRAQKILDAGQVLESHLHTFQRGARKGDTELRWAPGRDGTPWEVVVSIYESAGLTEAEALMNARVARICRAEDYDFVKQEVILWTPTAL